MPDPIHWWPDWLDHFQLAILFFREVVSDVQPQRCGTAGAPEAARASLLHSHWPLRDVNSHVTVLLGTKVALDVHSKCQ